MLTVRGLVDEIGLELAAGERRRRRAGALGAHLGAARPHAVALGRRAAAHHRLPARHRREPARVRAAAGSSNLAGLGFGTGFDHEALPAGARGRGGAARVPGVRGALRAAVHRAHREGVHAARERAVRRAPARHRDPQAARAAGARGAAGWTSWCGRLAAATGGGGDGALEPWRHDRLDASSAARCPPAAVREVRDEVRRRSEALGSAARPARRPRGVHARAGGHRRALARAAGGHPRRRRRRRPGSSRHSTPVASGTSIA